MTNVRWTTALFVVSAACPIVAAAQSATIPPPAPTETSAPAAAQESSVRESATGFAANMKFDVSNSSQGAFVQLLPEIGYDFTRWGMTIGVPVESASASSTSTGAPSHRGMGDAYLKVHYTIDSDRAGFSSAVMVTLPTGDSTVGLGAGQATWNWTNHIDRAFAWLTPFLDAGVGNSINSNTSVSVVVTGARVGRSRMIAIPTQPYMTVGRVARLDAGLDVNVGSILGFGVLAYDTIPSGDQTALSRFIPATRPRAQTPISRSIRGQRFFEQNAVTQGTASLTRDNGFGGSVSVDPTRYLDISITYSHSVPMQLDVLSVTVTTKLAGSGIRQNK